MKISVDIVIPVLNEEKLLKKNLLELLFFAEKELSSKFDYKIIIADNGSTDQTHDIGIQLSKDYKDKIKYHKISSRGVGLALKYSWKKSNADFIGYMDLDLATDLNHLPDALDELVNVDVVYGTRLHKKSKVIGRTLKRELISRIFNSIVKVFLKTSFSDGMCGFKFLKNIHLEKIMASGAVSDGWFFCTEILVVSEWQGLKLYELPVKWTDSADSKVNIIKLSSEYLSAIWHLKKQKN